MGIFLVCLFKSYLAMWPIHLPTEIHIPIGEDFLREHEAQISDEEKIFANVSREKNENGK